MNNKSVTVDKVVLEQDLKYKDVPVLHYRIEYPRFSQPDHQHRLNTINEWYRAQAENLQREYETELYWDAAATYDNSVDNDFPFHNYDAITEFAVTYNDEGVLSLYSEDYIYSGGAHGSTRRHSETWNTKTGQRIHLYQFAGDPAEFRAEILEHVRKQIERQRESGERGYFDDYARLISEHFNPENFYLTPEGLVIYYQQYDIAPYASGIPEFTIPL